MISFLISLVVFGFVVYLVRTYIPMAEPFLTLFNVLVVVIVILYVFRYVGYGNYGI